MPISTRILTAQGQGLGIALVAAQKAQIPVIIIDNSQASIDKGLKFAGASKSVENLYPLGSDSIKQTSS